MAAPPTGEEDEGDDKWRFSLEEVGSQDDPERHVDESEDEPGGNVAGTLERNQPLEPGEVDLKNAAFVVLGVLIVVVLIAGAIIGI